MGTILVVTGLAREARIAAGPGVVALAGGAAPELAERIEAAVSTHAPEAILSFGLAGALADGLGPGDLVVGSAVVGDGQSYACDPGWRARIVAGLPPLRSAGDIVAGADQMLVEASAKRAMRARTGAAIVDMESLAAARVAMRHGLPFAVLRAVSDAAARNLPKAVLCGMKPDGGMDLKGVLGSLARDPRQLPELIRAGLEAERGFKALDHARRLLGPRLGRPDLGELLLDVG